MLFGNWKLTLSGEVERLETDEHLWSDWDFSDFCRTLAAVQSRTALEAQTGKTARTLKEMTFWGFKEWLQEWSSGIHNTPGDTKPERF